jgi:hypothetical protein
MGEFEDRSARTHAAEVRRREANRRLAASKLLDLFEDQEQLAMQILGDDLELPTDKVMEALKIWRKQAKKRY